MKPKLLRHLFGFVKFTATGGFTERFVNLTTARGIPVWNTSNSDGVYTGETSLLAYRELEEPARKSGVDLTLISEHGLPIFLRNMYPRIGFLVGLLAFLILLTVYSKTIWRVDVTGNTATSSETILSVASEAGLYQGALRGTVKSARVRNAITGKLPNLAWVSVNIDGCRADIQVLEGSSMPSFKAKKPKNVVASEDGIITSIAVREGEKAVAVGDSVCKGDLLVSGAIYYENTKATVLHSASAKVLAQVSKKHTVEVKKNYTTKRYTGKSVDKRELYFWGIRVPLYLFPRPKGDWVCAHSVSKVTVSGVQLPIRITHNTFFERETVHKVLTVDGARRIANAKADKWELGFPNSSRVLRKSVKVKESDTSYKFTYKYLVEEDIAKQVPLVVKKNK